MSRLRLPLVLAATAPTLLMAAPAEASFHLWDIAEVFSTADGRVQFIEFTTTVNGQHLLSAHQITANSDGTTVSFTIPTNLAPGTVGRRFIVATPGFSDLPGAVAVDYVLPCGPFFNPAASSITISLVGADSLTFTGAQLPTDGISALIDSTPAGVPTLSAAAATPTNYSGATGALSLPACVISGTCDACDDGVFCNGPELCVGSACVATPVCTGLRCDEVNDRCFECATAVDCEDNNACTDNGCDPNGQCTYTPNTAPCNDGLFCTLTDVCAQGSCVGADSPCRAGQQCFEAASICGECAVNADCDDGLFCNGAESCGAATCIAGTAPCQLGETCDEALDRCVRVDPPDAGFGDASDPDLGTPDLGGPMVDAGGQDATTPPADAAMSDAAAPAPDAAPEPDAGLAGPDAGSPEVDAGSPEVDAGSAELDAGSPGLDAGSPLSDAGSPLVDAGAPLPDAGGQAPDSGANGEGKKGGCGCSVPEPSPPSAELWLGLAASALVVHRRARKTERRDRAA